jgi:hypothetical protein
MVLAAQEVMVCKGARCCDECHTFLGDSDTCNGLAVEKCLDILILDHCVCSYVGIKLN